MGAFEAERGPGARARNRARWRAHVAAQLGSELSAAAYCRAHGLNPRAFRGGSESYWRRVRFPRRLRRRAMPRVMV
ncbi:MAG: IS66 family insertion sequence element accessory protein TnpA [Candidatus Hydrogenedentota bacterium]